jgi:hypothetical protein
VVVAAEAMAMALSKKVHNLDKKLSEDVTAALAEALGQTIIAD